MLIKDQLPSELLEYDIPIKFVDVMDMLQQEKNIIIAEAMREHNASVLLNKRWFIKKFADYGMTNIPENIPLEVMIQIFLNLDTLMSLRGSKIGIQFVCSLFSLGEITAFDDSKFFDVTREFIFNTNQGVLVDNTESPVYYLVDKTETITAYNPLKLTIATKYNSDASLITTIKDFTKQFLTDYIGFSANPDILLTYTNRSSLYYHSLLNSYFHE